MKCDQMPLTEVMKKNDIVDITAIGSTGLLAGLYFAYSTSVIPAFTHLSDQSYVDAFQRINVAIENPVFFLVFTAAPVALIWSAISHYRKKDMLPALAAGIFIVGSLGVTMMGNVPLNDKLAETDLATATAQQISAARDAFEGPWNGLHAVRTVASVVSFALALYAAKKRKSA